MESRVAKLLLAVLLTLGSRVTARSLTPSVTCPTSGTSWIPHPLECSSFFQCSGNKTAPALLLRCPNGLHFSQNSDSQCQSPKESNCFPQIVATPLPTPKNTPQCPDSALHYVYLLPDPHHCAQFFRCFQGTAYHFRCPQSLRFDPVMEICHEHIADPECSLSNDRNVLLPHPTDCNAFYQCNWGKLYLHHCPQFLKFNHKTQVCDWKTNVDCNRCSL
ncbi:peritrophin-1-like [Periplaneta americana]|uniref:peritrophin-1-like n=1 Tax=Periplaneta americana TaxID=6978 RepID=UPI0037E7BAFB